MKRSDDAPEKKYVNQKEEIVLTMQGRIDMFASSDDIRHHTQLCEIMARAGSDKSTRHQYTRLYHFLWNDWRDKPIRLLEIGIGTNYTDTPSSMGPDGVPAASLRGWQEYFHKAKDIIGADIDVRILDDRDPGITKLYVDQCDRQSLQTLSTRVGGDESLDIIIEDGLHAFHANIKALEELSPCLKVGGYYIVEDVDPNLLQKWCEYLRQSVDNQCFQTAHADRKSVV